MPAQPTTLIDGSWVELGSRKDLVNPVDGSVVGSVGYGGRTEARIDAMTIGDGLAEPAIGV